MQLLYWLIGFILPTQLGKYWFFDSSYVGGVPIDYLSLSLFASQVLIILTALYLFFTRKSRVNVKFLALLFGVTVACIITSKYTEQTIFSLTSWASVAILSWLMSRSNKDQLKSFFLGLIVSGVVQLVLVLGQFFWDKNVGSFGYWLGERELSFGIANVARMTLFGVEKLRPYGTFSHPNSLSGFAMVAFVILFLNRRLLNRRLLWMVWAWLLCGLITFSKAGWVSLLVMLMVSRFQLKLRWIVSGSLIITLIMVLLATTNFVSGREFVDLRLMYTRAAVATTADSILFGAGLNGFTKEAFLNSREYARGYSYQPVHNLWLLGLSELGLTGVFLGIALVLYLRRSEYKLGNHVWVICIILVTGTFDHYWLSLIQNKLMIAIVIGLILRDNRRVWRTAK